MQQALVVLWSFVSAAILSPVLWYWWNNVLNKFITIIPQVTLWDSALFLLGLQIIPFFLVRRVQVQYVHIPHPFPVPAVSQEAIEAAVKNS